MLHHSIIYGACFFLIVSFGETIRGAVPKTGVHLKPVSVPEAPAARVKKTIVDAHASYHGHKSHPTQENIPPAHQSSLHGKDKPLNNLEESNGTVTMKRVLPGSKGGSAKPENTQTQQSSFAAFTVTNSGTDQGPYPDVKIVTFNRVVTNIGGAFDPMFNVFTSKVSGVYFFSVSILGSSKNGADLMLVHDGRSIVHSHGAAPVQTAVMTAYIHVVAGGRVWVSLEVGSTIYGHRSTFSGSLVKADAAK